MRKVVCIDNGKEYFFNANSGIEAMIMMRDFLNISNFDKNAKIKLHNETTWELTHGGSTFGCLAQ